MKKLFSIIFAAILLAITATNVSADPTEPGRETLQSNDGWAAFGEGTTGGAAADEEHIFTVTNKEQLLHALGGGDNHTPKIIYVKGTIAINTDAEGNPVGPEYYADSEYRLDAYLKAYDPATWGYEKEVYGPLEEARNRSQDNQKKQIVIDIGSNTSIIGLGEDAKITGGNLNLDGVENIIIRNLEVEAPIDFFPQWDPTDGEIGNWNSEYDAVNIKNGTHHVWIDHNTFTDGKHRDSEAPVYFDKIYQQHDGLIDVTNEANYVTISYNNIENHDKTLLIGSSDSKTGDRNHLKVTIHHNYFKDVKERLPRVRYGEVHVYNNYFEITTASDYDFGYAFGVGVESKIYAENNFFAGDIDPSKILRNWRGTSIFESGSMLNGTSKHHRVDLVAAHNKANSEELALNEDVGWKPALYERIDPTQSVPNRVKAKAGSGNLPF